MNKIVEKRENNPMPEAEMYEIADIDQHIKKERRRDELDRLNEVRQQKKVWQHTVGFASILVLILLILAYMGWTNNV